VCGCLHPDEPSLSLDSGYGTMILTDAAVCISFFSLIHPSFWIQDTVPDGTDGDSSKTQPGVEKSGQPGETDPKKQLVHEDGGSKNDTNGSNKKDNSTELAAEKMSPYKSQRTKIAKQQNLHQQQTSCKILLSWSVIHPIDVSLKRTNSLLCCFILISVRLLDILLSLLLTFSLDTVTLLF
jgi:hypothetical protein